MQEGDAFTELYASVGQRLWRAIYMFTGGQREMTDDVVAEAFVRTLERGDSVRDRGRYVYPVAFRLAAFELRRPAILADVPEQSIVSYLNSHLMSAGSRTKVSPSGLVRPYWSEIDPHPHTATGPLGRTP